MKWISRITALWVVAALVGLMTACEKEYLYEPPPPPPPDVSEQTATLEAVLVTTPPDKVTSKYWKTADYLKVTAADVSKMHLYSDGFLNMTGTYGGLTDFNGGNDPGLTLKAAYDQNNLYILAEWTDSEVDASNGSWRFNGPTDPLKPDTTGGWTSQRNSDKLAFAFEVDAASSNLGTFTNVGCAASCHSVAGIPAMHPASGKVDLWNWSLATSNPMGYAHDEVANGISRSNDAGLPSATRNAAGPTARSGPAWEWDGVGGLTCQVVILPLGGTSYLNAGFYLLNKMPFSGDIQAGNALFHNDTIAECKNCHGQNGGGGSAAALTLISYNQKSRSELENAMNNEPDMIPYWGPLSSTQRNDIIAFLRGLSGVPGYFLNTPSGSCADITAASNVSPVDVKNALNPSTNQHTKYQVLLIRKLQTGNNDDIQFAPATQKTVTFGVALMDNDGINHIGSAKETLTFK